MESITEQEIYRKLHDALKAAVTLEQQLRSRDYPINSIETQVQKMLDTIINKELPTHMGKMISELELQRPFQLLGRYVRSFEDAEFVVRNLKEQIILKLSTTVTEPAYAAICNLIGCSNVIAEKG